jgi:hypothetical protein
MGEQLCRDIEDTNLFVSGCVVVFPAISDSLAQELKRSFVFEAAES